MPSPHEHMEFEKLDNNQIWNDFRERYGPGGMFESLHDDNLQSLIAELISQSLKDQKKQLVREIEGMKLDERKVGKFGLYEARTYEEKELANAVLSDIITLIEKNV